MRKCSICREFKAVECFSPTKRNEDGTVKYRHSQCSECRTDKNRKTPKFTETSTHKECRDCRISKLHSEFSPSKRGKCGVSAYCKKCQRVRYPNVKSAEYTKAYRERHPERWKALHRLHQLKRRSNIEATCDGTLTDEALREIYSREFCFWCCKFVEPVDRTLEHVVELSSVANIQLIMLKWLAGLAIQLGKVGVNNGITNQGESYRLFSL